MSGMVDFGTAAATVVGVAAAVSDPSAVGEVAVPVPGTRVGTVGAEGIVGAARAPVVERGAPVAAAVVAGATVTFGIAVVAMDGAVVTVDGAVVTVAVSVEAAAVVGVLPPSATGEPNAACRIDARCHVPLFTTARISGELTASLVAVDGSFSTTAVPVLGGMR